MLNAEGYRTAKGLKFDMYSVGYVARSRGWGRSAARRPEGAGRAKSRSYNSPARQESRVSADHLPDEPLARFPVTEAGKPAGGWTLEFYPDYLRLVPADGDLVEVDRADLPERVRVFERGLFLRRLIAVKIGRRSVPFQLLPDGFAALKAWVGPPTEADLRASLKRRLGWVTPVGLIFVLTALPLGHLDWDPVALGLGLGLILTARLARLWPHRAFFLVVAGWFALLAANSAWLLYQEGGWFRAVVLAFQLMLAWNGWREYRRFAPTPPADETADGMDER